MANDCMQRRALMIYRLWRMIYNLRLMISICYANDDIPPMADDIRLRRWYPFAVQMMIYRLRRIVGEAGVRSKVLCDFDEYGVKKL